jgi:saccharopine dehydrogenase-like NADP-dependent oxidoreductase
VRAARGCQLIVNASASVFNQIVMRAALRLRAHYVDLSSHLTRNPFKAEQLSYAKRFEEKNRTALINAGAAPGLTNLLVMRAAEMLDDVHSVHIRLYESAESDDPISQWSPEGSFDEAISNTRLSPRQICMENAHGAESFCSQIPLALPSSFCRTG